MLLKFPVLLFLHAIKCVYIVDDHLVLFRVMFYSGGLYLVRSLNVDISLQ